MRSIPLINIIAVIHLYFIASLATCGLIEIVMEYYSLFFNRKFHHCAIRMHHWIDTFVEIPMFVGAVASGITMAFLVETLSFLHFVKIGAVICAAIVYIICFRATFRRSRMLDENQPEEALISATKKMMVRNAVIAGIFTAIAVSLGFWLAYHRVLESIYG